MRIAIGQIAPVLLDRRATLARVMDAMREAEGKGARLIAFGEALAPGYPVWLSRTHAAAFDDPRQKRLHARYLAESVRVDTGAGGDLREVCAEAKRLGIMVVLGVCERATDRGGHSIYCSRVVIAGEGPEAGRVLSVHRKLMPTYEERLSWAIGDGAGLVTHTLGEFRLGALNCWENWMPLARAALYAQGENLRVALWPGGVHNTRDITPFLAKEGRAFVISASSIRRASDIAPNIAPDINPGDMGMAPTDEWLCDGGSCVAGPDGGWVLEPQVAREGVFFADLDIQRVLEERQNFDPAGHYARPDVLTLQVRRDRQATVRFLDGPVESSGESPSSNSRRA